MSANDWRKDREALMERIENLRRQGTIRVTILPQATSSATGPASMRTSDSGSCWIPTPARWATRSSSASRTERTFRAFRAKRRLWFSRFACGSSSTSRMPSAPRKCISTRCAMLTSTICTFKTVSPLFRRIDWLTSIRPRTWPTCRWRRHCHPECFSTTRTTRVPPTNLIYLSDLGPSER